MQPAISFLSKMNRTHTQLVTNATRASIGIQESDFFINHTISKYKIGDYASIFGVLIAIIGFFVTITNIRKSKKLAEHAAEEVVKIRNDIKNLNKLSELASAIHIINEIKILQRYKLIALLPDKYSKLCEHLINIKSTHEELTLKQKTHIQSSIQFFRDSEKQSEAVLLGEVEINIPQNNNISSKYLEKLIEILVTQKNLIMG